MCENNRECAGYFKGQRAYRRCFQELLKKWKSYGKAAGRIALKNASEEERKAIGGLLGKNFYEETICFSFSDFEKSLQKTRYAPIEMKRVLEEYFGEELCTNRGKQETARKEKQEFWERCCDYFRDSAEMKYSTESQVSVETEHLVKSEVPTEEGNSVEGEKSVALLWLQAAISEKKYGYHLLNREYQNNPTQAEALIRNVGQALEALKGMEKSGTESPLAVFAAEISGNPHYFDRGTGAGQLLVHGICYLKGETLPETAHGWRNLLQNAGVIPDNVSSMVHVYGLRLHRNNGWHPAYEAFCQLGEPCVITMENLRGITGVQAAGQKIYVVENEMVFTWLLNRVGDKKLTLLCTSGQLRAVAVEMISLLLDSGADIYYSGDLDPDGLGIADRLWQRFGNHIHMWRMSEADYEKSLSGEPIDRLGMAKLEHIEHPLLKKTATAIQEKARAGYQENILEELLGDIL